MYNRYIPQSDGTYTRNRVPDVTAHPPAAKPEILLPESVCEPPRSPAPDRKKPRHCPPPPCPRSGRYKPSPKEAADSSILSFFRQLLPRDFDSGDLLVILLLLLMSGDCVEDQNTALLTLALYLFL